MANNDKKTENLHTRIPEQFLEKDNIRTAPQFDFFSLSISFSTQ